MTYILLQGWWTFCAVLVFIMLIGFLLLESGWVPRRHMSGIAIKNVCMFLASSFAFSLFGYRLMWGESLGGLIGNPLRLDDQWYVGTSAWQLYQTGFASVSATIISGAIAGRTTLYSNILAAACIAGIVYPIHGHWIWHEHGWLSDTDRALFRSHDYAGSSGIHIIGGICALFGCLIAGKRLDFKVDDRIPLPYDATRMEPNTPHLAAAGVLVLVIGWIGFNGGNIRYPSEGVTNLDADQLLLVSSYIQYTVLAASAGGLSAFVLSGFRIYRKNPGNYVFHAFSVLSGTMGGMVAITAWCDLATAPLALLVGCLGGLATTLTSWLVGLVWKIDDPVDAIGVHAGGGIAGMISLGIFFPEYIQGQIVSVATAIALSALVISLLFGSLKLLSNLPISGEKHLLVADSDEQGIGLSFTNAFGNYATFNFIVLVSMVSIAILIAGLSILDPAIRNSLISLSALIVVLSPFYRWLRRRHRPTGVDNNGATATQNQVNTIERNDSAIASATSSIYHRSEKCKVAQRIQPEKAVRGKDAIYQRKLHENCKG